VGRALLHREKQACHLHVSGLELDGRFQDVLGSRNAQAGLVGLCSEFSRRDALLALASGAIGGGPALAQQQTPTRATRLIAAARSQVGVTTIYDPAYVRLAFPRGDVPRERGVCTDVIIRAYRDSLGVDLQALLNADMRAAFGAYPRTWGLRTTDANIDHRRVPNLQAFLARKGARLTVSDRADDWKAGDLVTSLVGGTLPHIGIVSDRKSLLGRPLVIHNIGRGTQEEDVLFAHRITGRYRWV
jgi:uncharacterized protein